MKIWTRNYLYNLNLKLLGGLGFSFLLESVQTSGEGCTMRNNQAGGLEEQDLPTCVLSKWGFVLRDKIELQGFPATLWPWHRAQLKWRLRAEVSFMVFVLCPQAHLPTGSVLKPISGTDQLVHEIKNSWCVRMFELKNCWRETMT